MESQVDPYKNADNVNCEKQNKTFLYETVCSWMQKPCRNHMFVFVKSPALDRAGNIVGTQET